MMPEVSIIIPVYNEKKKLGHTERKIPIGKDKNLQVMGAFGPAAAACIARGVIPTTCRPVVVAATWARFWYLGCSSWGTYLKDSCILGTKKRIQSNLSRK